MSEQPAKYLDTLPKTMRDAASQNLKTVAENLGIDEEKAGRLIKEVDELYVGKMRARFSELRLAERIKRTNPFLLYIRGAETVKDWAVLQIRSSLFASEEEAVGHVLEAIAKYCYPKAQTPQYTDDLDFEVEEANTVKGFQVKMSWDCMPMSSRKNLSNTIRELQATYKKSGKQFEGYFAPCYGKAQTTRPKGQSYTSLSSRDFWKQVGDGDPDFDVRVGEVCALLLASARQEIESTLVPALAEDLAAAAQPIIGTESGKIDYQKLFRRINK